MIAKIKLFLIDDNGATAIEYAVIASLVSIAAFTFITNIGTSLSATFETVANSL